MPTGAPAGAGVLFGLVCGAFSRSRWRRSRSRCGVHHYWQIMLPGSVLGMIVGHATQRATGASTSAQSARATVPDRDPGLGSGARSGSRVNEVRVRLWATRGSEDGRDAAADRSPQFSRSRSGALNRRSGVQETGQACKARHSAPIRRAGRGRGAGSRAGSAAEAVAYPGSGALDPGLRFNRDQRSEDRAVGFVASGYPDWSIS